jgi:molybdopterin adenylyltransferase
VDARRVSDAPALGDPSTSPVPIGILVLSDRAAAGEYEDRSGPAIRAWLDSHCGSAWHEVYRVIPDDRATIERTLVAMADEDHCALIVTTGGTGPAPRDVTPDATTAVCDRMLPGFGEAMRAASLRTVPTAILSRQTAGTRGGSLIVNLPGKPVAIAVCLDAIRAAIPPAIRLIGGPTLELRLQDA